MSKIHFNISSENKLKLKVLFFICLYWVVMTRIFILLNFFGFYSFNGMEYTPLAMVILRQSLFAASGAGLILGLLTGLIELYIFPKRIHHYRFVVVFALKMISYFLSIFLVAITTIIIHKLITTDDDFLEIIVAIRKMLKSKGFISLLYGGFLLSIGINLLVYFHNRIGFGNFIPMLIGKYHIPKEEDRIFLFLDLQSSSFAAEKLGHENYSKLLQKCFLELNDLLMRFNGTVYQYVGDEAVITWKSKPKNYLHAIELFMKFQTTLESKCYEFFEKFGVMPLFKGAVHSGKVMAAEVGGSMKKEVAYHGDVLNSASRIMEHCKPLDNDLLISETVRNNLKSDNLNFAIKEIGPIPLRGKNKTVKIFSISE